MPLQNASMRITAAEHRQRLEHLLEHVQELKACGVVLFDRDYILYYSGFAFIPTERPMALLAHRDGQAALFVPRLELEHARANAVVEAVYDYPEYPGETHPMERLAAILRQMDIGGTIAADEDGYPWILGYRGPRLSQVTGAQVLLLRQAVEDQMAIKSPAEIALIGESVRWGNLAHQLLQRYTAPGKTETEVSQRASQEATRAMLDAIGPIYRALNPFSRGASAGYRGQIGRHAAIPHAMAANITFRPGDVLVSGASAAVWGYLSELERTMIIGPASDEQKRFFDHMLALQDLAMSLLEPGVPCAEVDRAVRRYVHDHDLEPYWRHHSGHAIGLRYHEGPFLDSGDQTVIQPGMVFTVEPGLYVPRLGGFRHSDTVLITEQGAQMLTYYPRDLESLTIPV